MKLSKTLISVSVVLSGAGGAALAQDYAQPATMNALQRVSSGPTPGSQRSTGLEADTTAQAGGNASAGPGDPLYDPAPAGRHHRLPKAGGDPLTLSAAGAAIVSLGYGIRRRVRRDS